MAWFLQSYGSMEGIGGEDGRGRFEERVDRVVHIPLWSGKLRVVK
jgi:hypothetical protein